MLIDLREKGWKEERERDTSMEERNIDQLPPVHTPTTVRTQNPGMCPDQESNRQPFGVQGQRSKQLSHPARALGRF